MARADRQRPDRRDGRPLEHAGASTASSAASSRIDARRRRDRRHAPSCGPAAATSSATSGRSARPRAASLIDERITIPDALTTSPASGSSSRPSPASRTRPGSGAGRRSRYPDRKRGARLGRWSSSVTDLAVPYVRPQENGGRADVRWLELADGAGRGLRLDVRPADAGLGDPLPGRRPRGRDPRHRPRRRAPETIVHVDVAHRGLGTGELRAGHAGASTWSGPASTRWTWSLESGRRRAGSRVTAADRVARGGPPAPPLERPAELHPRDPRERRARAPPRRRAAGHRSVVPPPRPAAVRRVREPARRSGRARIPDAGQRRLPRPGARRRAAGRLDRPRAGLPRRTGSSPASRPLAGLPVDVRRGGRRGGDASRSTSPTRGAASSSTLSYTIFRDVPAIARSVRLRNAGGDPLRVETAMSLVLDLPDDDWELVHLGGYWARERHVVDAAAGHGPPVDLEQSRLVVGGPQPVRGPPPRRRRPRSTARRSGSPSSTRATSSPRSRSSRSGRPGSGSGSIPRRSPGRSRRARS